MTEKSPNSTLMSLLLAALLGAGIALLLAPRSGKETRRSLHQTTDDLRETLEENLHRAQKTLEQNIARAQEVRDNIVRHVRQGDQVRDAQALIEHINRTDTRRHTAPRSSVLSTWEEEI